MDTFLEDEVKEEKKNRGEWARMNVIQKAGAIGFFVLLFGGLAVVDETHQAYVEVGAQTSLFLGWVAGSLWKVRHALHFWWSLLVAILGHLCLLSTYLRISRYLDSGHHSGREVGTVIVGMIAVETILFLVLLKKVAMWIHRRSNKNSRTSYVNR
jgi:hypothetical protein